MGTLYEQKSKTAEEHMGSAAYDAYQSVPFVELYSSTHGKACSDGNKLEKKIFSHIDPKYHLPNKIKTIDKAIKFFEKNKSNFTVGMQLQYDLPKNKKKIDYVILERKSGIVYITLIELKSRGPFDGTKIKGEITTIRDAAEIVRKKYKSIKVDVKITAWYSKTQKALDHTLSKHHKDVDVKANESWLGKEFARKLRINYKTVSKIIQKQFEAEAPINRKYAYEKIVEGAGQTKECDILQKELVRIAIDVDEIDAVCNEFIDTLDEEDMLDKLISALADKQSSA